MNWHTRFNPVPRMLRWLALGMLVSWGVALGHWTLVEIDVVPRGLGRGAMEDAASGLYLLDQANDLVRRTFAFERWQRFTTRLEGYGYGWPTQSLAVIMAESNATGVPSRSERVFIGIDLNWALPRGRWTPLDHRVIPLYPAVGQSLAGGAFYGVILWLAFVIRRRVGRKQVAVVPCPRCGYELAGLAGQAACPECGATRSAPAA